MSRTLRVGVHAGQLLQPVPGGIGRYVARLVEHLPRAGVTVVPFAAGAPPSRVHGHPPGEQLREAWVDLGRPRGRWRYEAWHRLGLPALRLDADVIHAPSLAIPPVRDVPLVVTIHDLAFLERADFHTRHGGRFHRRGLALARRAAAVVVVPSPFVAGEVTGAGFDEDRVVVAPHGADPPPPGDDEHDDERLGELGVRPPYLLHVGTAEARKGTDTVLSAFPELRERHPDLRLVLVSPGGWGDMRPVDGAIALGGVGDAGLRALYRRAVALVYASRHEGFGMPVLEAMTLGCPVIAGDRSSLPWLAGDAAILVDPDDGAALATGLVRLVEDEALRDDLVAAGRERAARFSWDESAARHAEAYALAAGVTPSRSPDGGPDPSPDTP